MSDRPKITTVGLETDSLKLFETVFSKADLHSIPLDLEKLMEPLVPEPAIIIVQASSIPLSVEVAQTLRMQYIDHPIFLLCTNPEGFERKAFIKNGFTDAFLLPMDRAPMEVALNEAIAGVDSNVQVFRSVKLLDLEAGETLDFDTSVFLPSNKKYVKICNAGDEIDSARLDKIKKNKINNLYVPSNQIQSFYQYSAKKLRKMGQEGAMGATERKEKLISSVRELMSGMFSQETATFQSGQAVLKNCSGIVSEYIVQGAEAEWFLRIQQVIGEFGDHYSHSSNVSTLSALFSMGTGIGKPEDLALAGLLHDIGKSLLPADIQSLEAEDMNPQQFEQYSKHPEMSVNLIKQKKIVVSDLVSKMILQHHELFNGSGFPSGFYGDRICKEAQLLALADRFDHITKLKPGRPLVTPAEAVSLLRNEQVNDPSKIKYNPDILKSMLELFPTTP